jgi:GNAT superfamily N-acetyltransferase
MPSGMRIERRSFDDPDVQSLVARIQQLYVVLYGGLDLDPTETEQFEPPHGAFLVGYLDGAPVACGGWRHVPPDRAEIKRMYVVEEQRGRGLARELLAALEASARESGAGRMVLSTGFAQPEAMQLYDSSGYERTDERYGHYAAMKGAYFFTKRFAD